MNQPRRAISGFTLVEMLIVMMIIAVTIPLLMTIFVSVIRQQARVLGVEQTKAQADSAYSSMKLLIRNRAISVHSAYPATSANEICNTQTTNQSANPLVFKDADGNSFYFSVSSGIIASHSSKLSSPATLTTSEVLMSNFTTTCRRAGTSSRPTVNISFDATSPLIPFSLTYQATQQLRNR